MSERPNDWHHPTFVVALRARSHVTVRVNEDIRIDDVPLPNGYRGRIRLFTRRADFHGLTVPRELVIAIDGPAPSFEAMQATAIQLSDHLWPLLVVAANAPIWQSALLTAFETTPGVAERPVFHEFHQSFASINSEPPVQARYLRPGATVAFLAACLTSPKAARLARASDQYRLALMHWERSRALLALGHLFMAAEALAPAALELEQSWSGASDHDLVELWEVQHDRGGWRRGDLQAAARRELVFHGDRECHDEAKTASDIYEHGFKDYGKPSRSRIGCVIKWRRTCARRF